MPKTEQKNIFDAASISYGDALFFLKVLYEKALELTDVASEGTVRFDSQILSHYYSSTYFLIEKIFKRGDFKKFSGAIKYLFLTLMGNNELDTEWEFSRKEAYIYLAEIEQEWIAIGRPRFDIPEVVQKIFKNIDEAILRYKNRRLKSELIFKKLSRKYIAEKEKEEVKPIEIKTLLFDEKNCLLEINGGEKIISFSSKRKEESNNQTKQFKIFSLLWEYRFEIKKGKTITKGDFLRLGDLTRKSGVTSDGATRKTIERLNDLFKKKRVQIYIEGAKGKYRLIIYKS